MLPFPSQRNTCTLLGYQMSFVVYANTVENVKHKQTIIDSGKLSICMYSSLVCANQSKLHLSCCNIVGLLVSYQVLIV